MPEIEYKITCTEMLPIHGSKHGRMSAIDTWTLASIAPCPNCGAHKLLWAENGTVPGYRMCEICGRTWIVKSSRNAVDNTISVWFAIPQTSEGPEWKYRDPDTSREAYEAYAERLKVHGGTPSEYRTWRTYQ